MRRINRILLVSVAAVQLAAIEVQGATLYQLDNNTISTALNASDGIETRDNWFGNVYTAVAGASVITRVDFGVFTSAGSPSSISLYRVTGAGGNPALGATRVYSQFFTPLTGDGTNAFLQQINLSTPVAFNAGDLFLVSVMIPNVIGAPPNDKYPFLLDTSGSAAGTFWDRSAPNTFNLDDLSGAIPINQAFVPGGYNPGPGHIFIRAVGIPEPAVSALAGLGLAATLLLRRRAK